MRGAAAPAHHDGRRGLFLSWAPFSRRTETLAAAFGLDARFMVTPWPKRPWTAPVKYPWQALRTAQALSRAGVSELWIMDPPSPLVTMAGAWARRHGVPIVVDMHTVAFFAREWRLLRPVELPWLRTAAAVIVTNDELAAEVRAWGARAFVLPDPLPAPPAGLDAAVEPGLVTVVATYSKDEPLEILPAVAERLPDVRFAVTGAPRGDLGRWPANLTATGFLSDDDYWRQLAPFGRDRGAHHATGHAPLGGVRGDGGRASARDLRPRRAARLLRGCGGVHRRHAPVAERSGEPGTGAGT